MEIILRGGPRDGIVIAGHGTPDSIRIPVIMEPERQRALTAAEWDDPANWEFDEYEGRWVPKRPKFGQVTYHRTDDVEDGRLVYR